MCVCVCVSKTLYISLLLVYLTVYVKIYCRNIVLFVYRGEGGQIPGMMSVLLLKRIFVKFIFWMIQLLKWIHLLWAIKRLRVKLIWSLKPGMVPHIFPNLPAYLLNHLKLHKSPTRRQIQQAKTDKGNNKSTNLKETSDHSKIKYHFQSREGKFHIYIRFIMMYREHYDLSMHIRIIKAGLAKKRQRIAFCFNKHVTRNLCPWEIFCFEISQIICIWE